MSSTLRKSDFKIGMAVTTDAEPGESHVIRKVIAVCDDDFFPCGFSVAVDEGEPCPHCGHISAKKLFGVDPDRLTPYKGG